MQRLIGKVINASYLPTVKVEVTRRWTHPLYHKTVTRRKRYLAHTAVKVKVGDKVILVSSRPVSKLKKWQVLKTVSI
jgi:small subunit ribosomal protein S17